MSPAGGTPVPADFGQARAAVDRHLGSVLGGRTLEAVGWDRPDPLTLYVPLRGYTSDTSASPTVSTRPSLPRAGSSRSLAARRVMTTCYACTSAITRTGRHRPGSSTRPLGSSDRMTSDGCRLISGTNELHVHASYGASGEQLICCSATLEFYLVNHEVEDQHRWRPGTSFAVTLNTLSRYLRPPAYTGRQGR